LDRDLLLTEVADRLGLAASSVSRIETGKAPTRTGYLNQMLDLYGLDDPQQRQELADLARQGKREDWLAKYTDLLPKGTARYIGLETAADSIRMLAMQFIPGLLQTLDYAQAAWEVARPDLDTEQIRDLVTLTGRRQEILMRPGFRLHAILDETALRRAPASTAVMTAQLRHLLTTEAEMITVQVLPLAVPWPVIAPAFTLLQYNDSADRAIAALPGSRDTALTSQNMHLRNLDSSFTTLARTALPQVESARLIQALADA
jgi:transcriptional regulator with XRE-family HTH domain